MAISSNATGLRPGVCTSTTRPTTPYLGQLIFETDTFALKYWNGSSWQGAVSAPAGTVTQYAGSTAPTGWLICDGTAVSRTTYADLFDAIGTRYGTGNGSTTFNLPDAGGRIPVGLTSGAPTVPTTVTSSGTSGGTSLTTDNSGSLNHTHGGVALGAVSTYGIDGGSIAHSHSIGSHTHSLSVTANAIQFRFIIKF